MENTGRNRRRKLREIKVGSLVNLYKKPRHKKHAKLYRSKSWQGSYRDINHLSICTDKPNTAVPEAERSDPNYVGKAHTVKKILDDRGHHGWTSNTKSGGRETMTIHGNRRRTWNAQSWYKTTTGRRLGRFLRLELLLRAP